MNADPPYMALGTCSFSTCP
uniref:Uncharacterized protein n=1 Tax=Arundo donax TaxID=35708 RepID=A0A0A8ZND7_ARUDO